MNGKDERLVLTGDAASGFTLDAGLLARQFGWPTETLRGYMSRNMVASTVERGEGDDEGRWRLTVRCGNRRWQAIVGPDGAVQSHQISYLPLPAGH